MYNKLTEDLQKKIKEDRVSNWMNPYACFPVNETENITFTGDAQVDIKDVFEVSNSGGKSSNTKWVIRRNNEWDKANLWRPAFVRDINKIMNIPYYNRYADKTQVFSFVKNDDISRRAIHVQFVSRIARNIGMMLGLNLDLIEAIALGHDIGHTPFGHAGERLLNEIYYEKTSRYFNHNVHSVRVLDKIGRLNVSMQTLDGILCHNGELEQQEYKPCVMNSFDEFDKKVEGCYKDQNNIGYLTPCTLEGCVVRISDIIAYIGKDRQDAKKLGQLKDDSVFSKLDIGTTNAQIINNLVVNIIEKSYGKPYLQMDKEYFEALVIAKKENYKLIYNNDRIDKIYKTTIKTMMIQMYELFLNDINSNNKGSMIFTHHIDYVNQNMIKYSYDTSDYSLNEDNDIVADFIASMTDDFFIEGYYKLFPNSDIEDPRKGFFG